MSPKPIYFMDIDIAYKKGKSLVKVPTWCVTTYETPSDITRFDKKTISRLTQEFYGTSYKSDRKVIVMKINTKKKIGTTNERTDS